MKNLFKAMPVAFKKFARDEEGAQIIEYALIIAAVSLLLIASLQGLAEGDFTGWIEDVGALLNPA